MIKDGLNVSVPDSIFIKFSEVSNAGCQITNIELQQVNNARLNIH
jgi:hypothetical protein